MKFLLFELKNVCYNSYIYFTDALSSELKKRGHSVEIFSLSEEPFENIERYIDFKCDAIIDFNSELPRALMDDDSYFLDHIQAPFIDVLLDHPLYHHDSLKHKINNFNVVCLDSNHKKYIEQYYPHIKNILVSPMTGSLAFGKKDCNFDDFAVRQYDLTFCGSYTPPECILKSLDKIPPFLQDNVHNLIDMLLADPTMTIEDAVAKLASNEINDYINSDFPLHTQSFYLADAYVRALNRQNLIIEIDKNCSTPIHLFGAMWDKMSLKKAIIHRELPFNLTFTIFSKSKISLNIMPNFKAGAHDRVFSAQLNGSVSLTDKTILLDNEYTDMENILFYNLNQLSYVSSIIDKNLSDPDRLKKIAQAGNAVAAKSHTWTNICNLILTMISKD